MIPNNIKEIFEKVMIIELSSVLAGPLVGSYFAELGAEVIKIENKTTGGDVTRYWHLKTENPEELSAYYRAANSGKQSKMLDLTCTEDRDILYDLVKGADIIINNINLRSAERLGVHPRDLRQIKPNLIYAQLDGFDEDMQGRVAYDIVLQAETGYLSMTGSDSQETDALASANGLAKMPVAFIDVLAAHQLKEAILVALIKKVTTGGGTYLRTSLYGVALTSQKNQATNYLIADHIPRPMGTLHPNIAPYGEIITFKDGEKLILAVGNDAQFASLIECLHIQHLIDHELYKTNNLRLKNREELYKILSTTAKGLNFYPIYERFIKKGIPCGQIKNIKEVWDRPGASEYLNKRQKTPKYSAILFSDIANV